MASECLYFMDEDAYPMGVQNCEDMAEYLAKNAEIGSTDGVYPANYQVMNDLLHELRRAERFNEHQRYIPREVLGDPVFLDANVSARRCLQLLKRKLMRELGMK